MKNFGRKKQNGYDAGRKENEMNVLVTGPHGFVGAHIMYELKDAVPSPSLNGAGEDDVKRLVDSVKPDIIIHTAAISDISACERDPDASYRANVEIPLWFARTGIKLIAFSTDQVYSGCESDGPYKEDMTAPANLYARHKLEMEQRILEASPHAVSLRATWMYDMPIYGVPNRGNFLMNMLCRSSISFSSSQHRAVTYVREAAANIRKAMLLPGGIYNYGSENELTMMETARWLKEQLSLPIDIKEANPRHNLWMDCAKAKENGVFFKNTIDGLRQCIEDYGLRG